MQNKKYYTISEVTSILNIHSYQLRYLEKILPDLSVYKIRDRRYYTDQNLNVLRTYLANTSKLTDLDMITRIDNLIDKLSILAKENIYIPLRSLPLGRKLNDYTRKYRHELSE